MSFLPFFSFGTWILLIIFISLFVWYGSATFGVFEKLGIPGPKPLMYWGTLTRHNPVYYVADAECAQKYGRVFGLYEFRKPVLAVMDPDMLKTILVKECFTYFTNRRDFYLNGELYDAVNFAQDDHWRRIRTTVTPCFTSGRIKEMFDIMKNYSHKLTDSLRSKKQRDIFQQLNNSQTAGANKKDKAINGPTDHEIMTQITTMLSGYELSASVLTFLAYSLATNPQIMKRLQSEIDSTFPNKESIQYEVLMEMEYLDCVVSECLRLYPPVLRLERVAKETVKIKGATVPKGIAVMVPVYALHRDPEWWPEPEEFIPERFSKENKQNINPYTYLPFGIGPRNCLGKRFILVLVKLALVEVLQSYSFSVCEETEIPLKMSNTGILDTVRPIKLKVVKRLDGGNCDQDFIREKQAPVLSAHTYD